MLFIPTVTFGLMIASGYLTESFVAKMSRKYFDYLSDFELDNFERYYYMVKGQTPPIAPVLIPPMGQQFY